MINSITQIGKFQWETLNYRDCEEDLLKVFAEDPSDKGRYQQAIIIQMENIGEIHYIGVRVREYDSRDIYRYMYKPGSPNGCDLSPTAKLTNPEKTIPNKIIKRVGEVAQSNLGKSFDEQTALVNSMLIVLEGNQELIIKDIEQIHKNKDKDVNFFVTISLIDDGEELFPGDIPIFQYIFIQDSLRGLYYRTTGNMDTRVESGACSVCQQTGIETYGFASPFSFYTIDKPGYISGGFYKDMVSYNYPVCKSCSIWLLMGKKYLEENLTFNAFGKSLYIIPKTFNNKLLSRALGYLSRLNDTETFTQFREHYLEKEDRLFKYTGDMEEGCTFNFVFFREKNSSFRILLDLNDVLPSRLNTVFRALDDINIADFFSKFPISSQSELSIKINFSWLNGILENVGSDRYFLELFGSIISDKKIDYHFLMKFVSQELINTFNGNGKISFKLYTIISYGFLTFLHNLDLLNYNRKGEGSMNQPSRNVYDILEYKSRKDAFEAFFNDHKGFFDKPEKKAMFMIGYLTQKLLNIQMGKYDGNTPFQSRLKGLKLSKRDISRLYHEITSKLDEYGNNIYKQERGICAEYFVQTAEKWDILNEDISFFIALGMNMTHCFNFKEIENGENIEKDKEKV